MRVFTIGHRRRPVEKLIALLQKAGVETLVVRRLSWSRRNPQFNQARLAATLGDGRIAYLHAICHRKLIAELLVARGHEVVHLIRPGQSEPHRLSADAEVRKGSLFLGGERVA